LAADVPLGAFLSGGIDSSTIVALMRARARGPVRSFAIGFEEPEYDESSHAEAVARHLGVEHHTLKVSARRLLDVVPRLPTIYDEPFADPSQAPTYLLSQLTRGHVTVALSGDGGDELFAGYVRYAMIVQIASIIGRVPRFLRARTAALIRAMPSSFWRTLEPFVPGELGRSPLAARALRAADMVASGGFERMYRDLVGQWREPESVVIGGHEPVDPIWMGELEDVVADERRRAQLIDVLSYLPEDILVKVDRASMAVGLEVRAPLLDQDVVEFSWGLTGDQLVRDGTTKWLLRQVLYRHVPPSLVERPKKGFGFPLAEWLRGPLRAWAEDLLEPARIAAAGYLHPDPITSKWQAHLTGAADWSYRLWCVLMFEAWRRDLSAAQASPHRVGEQPAFSQSGSRCYMQ
jgi:asparagine synthase (glutamine-hydrolysing)